MRCYAASAGCRYGPYDEGRGVSQRLTIFPGMQSLATAIEVDVARYLGGVTLEYHVTGNIGALAIPSFTMGRRTNELWKHTCFEMFVRPVPDEAYFEFNFAPSTNWAAYGFSGNRTGMHNINAAPASIEANQEGQNFTLKVSLEFPNVPELTAETAWRVNLSAVIEEKGGAKSYWALAHPAGKPDFHSPDCFVLELPAA